MSSSSGPLETNWFVLPSMLRPDLGWMPIEPTWLKFPVRRGEETVGILLRGNHGSSSVHEVMYPIAEDLVVSADMAITRLIPKLGRSPYRLVLREGSNRWTGYPERPPEVAGKARFFSALSLISSRRWRTSWRTDSQRIHGSVR